MRPYNTNCFVLFEAYLRLKDKLEFNQKQHMTESQLSFLWKNICELPISSSYESFYYEIRPNWEDIEVRFLYEVISWRCIIVGGLYWEEFSYFPFMIHDELYPPSHINCRCFLINEITEGEFPPTIITVRHEPR